MLSVVASAWLLFQSVSTPLPPSKLLEVQGLIDRDRLVEAEAAARAYVAENPGAADGHFLLGYILFRRADMRASLAEYVEGAKHQDLGALDLAMMGSDAFLLEDYAAADGWFEQSVQKDPGSSPVWYQLGRTKYNEKRFEEAVNAMEPLDGYARERYLSRQDGRSVHFAAGLSHCEPRIGIPRCPHSPAERFHYKHNCYALAETANRASRVNWYG